MVCASVNSMCTPPPSPVALEEAKRGRSSWLEAWMAERVELSKSRKAGARTSGWSRASHIDRSVT